VIAHLREVEVDVGGEEAVSGHHDGFDDLEAPLGEALGHRPRGAHVVVLEKQDTHGGILP
jgi:hypothetical protein